MHGLSIALVLLLAAAPPGQVTGPVKTPVKPIKPTPKPSPLPTARPGTLSPGPLDRTTRRPADKSTDRIRSDVRVIDKSGRYGGAVPTVNNDTITMTSGGPPQSEHDRKVDACRKAKGVWQVEVRGVKLSAKGSDVDEIYGRIFVSTSDGGIYRPTRTGPGWVKNNLWMSQGNHDLGRSPVTNFPTLRIADIWGAERHTAKVFIHLDLRDEDDGHGGPNDEYFSAYGTIGVRTGQGNSVEFPLTVFDCAEQAEFRSSFYYTIFGAPTSQGEKNRVEFRFALTTYREFP